MPKTGLGEVGRSLSGCSPSAPFSVYAPGPGLLERPYFSRRLAVPKSMLPPLVLTDSGCLPRELYTRYTGPWELLPERVLVCSADRYICGAAGSKKIH